MLALFRKKEKKPELYPKDDDTLAEGVYNRWKASYLTRKPEEKERYSAMEDTVEYFIVSALDQRTQVVRVLKDVDKHSFLADYLHDLKVFDRSVSSLTASDVMNAYPPSEYVKEHSTHRDHFGLRRAGTIDDFVREMRK